MRTDVKLAVAKNLYWSSAEEVRGKCGNTGCIQIIGGFRYAMLEDWLMPQLSDEEVHGYMYQQDGAPPHLHKEVREYLNEHLPGRWVGRTAATDNTFCTWPPRSPDLTVRDFFLWGFVKDNVYVPRLPKTLPELRERINTAIGNVTQDMLERS